MYRSVLTLFSFLLVVSCKETKNEELALEWAQQNAIPLRTADPSADYDDLAVLNDVVGNARIVGLGEPTHGNREVFQMKHRVIKYLIQEKGFRVFALECPFGEAMDVNRYIQGGEGTAEQALAGIYYWAWDTQEMAELLRWMRAYNANSQNQKKVRFYGIDPQDPERAATALFDYLGRVDSAFGKSIESELGSMGAAFTNPELLGRRQYIPTEWDSTALRKVQGLFDVLKENKVEYVSKSSEQTYDLNWRFAKQLEYYVLSNINDGENYAEVRDRGQFENADWILDAEGPESKMIIWEHNCHLTKTDPFDVGVIGVHLAKKYKEEYKMIGMVFNSGSFRAIDLREPSEGMNDFTVRDSKEGTAEHLLKEVGNPLFLLNLNSLPKEGPVHDWFNEVRGIRHSGGGYDPKAPENYYWNYSLSQSFDALIYFESTTAVKVNDPGDIEVMWPLNVKAEKPKNLGLETWNDQNQPSDWFFWSKFTRMGAKVTADVDAYKGDYSALLQGPRGPQFGEFAYSVRQYIDASSYLKKRLRIRFAAKVEANEEAFFRVSIDPDPLKSAHLGLAPLVDNLDSLRIESKTWKLYEIEFDVPENSDILQYGIYLRGEGKIWLDDVSIEMLNK